MFSWETEETDKNYIVTNKSITFKLSTQIWRLLFNIRPMKTIEIVIASNICVWCPDNLTTNRQSSSMLFNISDSCENA